MKKTRNQILKKIKEYDSIIILGHQRPDGDCVGSTLGLKNILTTSFPKKKIYAPANDSASYLDFLKPRDEELKPEIYQESLVIVLDTATKERIDSKYFHLAKETIKIDHHLPVDDYADINFVDVTAPATAQIIVDLFLYPPKNLEMEQEGAEALFTGIVTDTGRFKYSNIRSQTLNAASLLLDYDIDFEKIYNALYLKDSEVLKLEGYLYLNFKTTENGVAYFYIDKKIRKQYNITIEDAASLVNCLDSIKGSLIWVLFVEQDDSTIRVRIRSRYVSIDDIANNYRGGGHKQASGATLLEEKEIDLILKELDIRLKEFKKENGGLM